MKVEQKQIRYFLQLLVHLRKNRMTKDQDGYAMLITSILAILMFSMLSVYLFSANLYKSVASAVVDNGTTFYAAESGMNSRANLVRVKFEGFSQPTGTSPINNSTDVSAQMQQCMSNRGASDNAVTVGTGDLRCVDTTFDYKESAWKSYGNGNFTQNFANDPNVKYRAYSFVRNLTGANPIIKKIPAGELYAGLNMQEYRYRIYTTAVKESQGYMPVSAQALLQMDFNSRVVPLFQFAAFYNGDLEILPGPAMILSGPVHSNGSLYLGGNESLTIEGYVTAMNSIFSKRKNDNSTYPNNRVLIRTTPTTTVSLLSANSGNATTSAMPISGLKSTFGDLVKAGAQSLTIPQVGFLSKIDSQQSSGIGQYYGKADLRIQYQPGQTNPLRVTAIKTGFTPNPTSCTNLSIPSDRNEFNNLACTDLSTEQLRSLQQPVLVRIQNANEVAALSPAGAETGLTAAPTNRQRNTALALQQAIVSQTLQVPLADLRGNSTLNSLNTPVWQAIKNNARFKPFIDADATLLTLTPQQIANQAGYFYRPAPIQIYNTFFNNRERNFLTTVGGGNLQMVQTDIKSLTIWNRDNVVVDASSSTISPTSTILASTGIGSDELLFKRLQGASITAAGSKYATVCNGTATDPRNRSFQCLGLAASDTSEGGFVLHATVDETIPASVPIAGTSSPYGFAFTNGSNLPGAMTIASDQAVYLQGDFNYFDNSNTTNPNNSVVTHPYNMSNNVPRNSGLKEPAAVLADSLNVLSNNCRNTATYRLNCGISGSSPNAINTNINAAFLAGVDVTTTGNYNGGLENYPRFHENWSADTLFYRGSFISVGESIKVLGTWGSQVYSPPIRNWNYDLAFNNVDNLPPLTPRLVYLKQKVFKRDYDSSRN